MNPLAALQKLTGKRQEGMKTFVVFYHVLRVRGHLGFRNAAESADSTAKFDPEGNSYDYETAVAYGLNPDVDGVWPARLPQTGQLLHGKMHPRHHEFVKSEQTAGNKVFKGEDGKYYSRKVDEENDDDNMPIKNWLKWRVETKKVD